jgi:serine/threonine-protein kinase RsbW
MGTLFSITLPAQLENLPKMITAVVDCAKARGFPTGKTSEIELAAEEALVNICSYAYPEQAGEFEVIAEVNGNDFIIKIIDSGIPFDITALSDPDVTADADNRKLGGLGVFLMKRMVDELRYRRENGRNILELIFKKVEEG